MLRSRLDVPNLPPEHWEHAHSPTFAAVLAKAYLQLELGRFEEAERLVRPYQTWPMSQGQRLRQLFIFATAVHQRLQYQQSIAYLEEAMALSMALDARAEFAELALLCAEAHHNLQDFGAAAVIAGQGLDAWMTLKTGHDPTEISTEIDLRDRYSVELFLCGCYQDALRQCYAAQKLTHAQPASKQAVLRLAALEWTIALLHRWRGNYPLAHQHVLGALSVYERLGSPDELARLYIVAADIILDRIVPMGVGIPYHYDYELIHRAQIYVSNALHAGDADAAASCMARLAHVRLSRALAWNEDRFAQLESLGHTAEQLHDLPLLGQVYTALGDEFGAAGKSGLESQLNCYRRAIGVVESSQAPAYSVWALRSLRRQEEHEEL
jgi:tetratricopeptide (TPR) repeat protein